ncbi:hypothetical protein DNTS_003858, partial [Danionella cerebrum]
PARLSNNATRHQLTERSLLAPPGKRSPAEKYLQIWAFVIPLADSKWWSHQEPSDAHSNASAHPQSASLPQQHRSPSTHNKKPVLHDPLHPVTWAISHLRVYCVSWRIMSAPRAPIASSIEGKPIFQLKQQGLLLLRTHLTWQQHGSPAHQTLFMRDKATQTPRAWVDERRRGSHKRSASCGSTDQLKEIAKLRQQLQRSKRSSRHRRDKERKSPFNGNHTIIQSQTQIPKTILIPIPISKSTPPRFRNSIEGLNQEIERIIIRDTVERDEIILPQDVPDGHRAPPPLPQRSSSTRSIDTQTPSNGGLSSNRSNSSSRADSVSPSYLSILNDVVGSSPLDDVLNESRERELGPWSPLPKYASSPKPNNSYMFKREPPEGCERVKAFEEN